MSKKNKDSRVSKNTSIGNGNINIQNSEFTINKGMDEILELAANGDTESALKKLGMLQRSFTVMHPLSPYYKYNINMSEKGVSIGVIANCKDALEKYPPHGKMKLIVSDEYKWVENVQELIRYGYEKQVVIELKAENLQLWLGDYLAKDAKGISKISIVPEKFPDPIPMRFEFENSLFALNYLEMGLTEIDGDWLIISNEKQKDAKIKLTLYINKINQQSKFNVRISSNFKDSVSANLMLNKFLINMSDEGNKRLICLRNDKEFMNLHDLSIHDYDNEEIKKELDLLERLKHLEEYYNVKFELPDSITQNDYENLMVVEKAMNNESIEGKYEEIELKLSIQSSSNQVKMISKSGIKIDISFDNHKVTLFGQTITFKEKWISYYNAVVEDYDRALNKIKYADDGDVIKVIYKPLDNVNNKFEIRYVYK